MTTIEFICDNPWCPDLDTSPLPGRDGKRRWDADAYRSLGITTPKNHKDENCPACGEPGRREWL